MTIVCFLSYVFTIPDKLYLSSTSSSMIVDDEKMHVLRRLKHDDSNGLELTKEVLPVDNTLPKPGTLKNLLMWSATFHYDVKIDKIKTKNGWNFPFGEGEKSVEHKDILIKPHSMHVQLGTSRYRLGLEISDDTAEVVVVLFDETTTSLLKCSASVMVASQTQVCFCTTFNLSDTHTDSGSRIKISTQTMLWRGGSNSAMVAAKADSKAPEVKSLNKSPLLCTPSKPMKKISIRDSHPKGDDVGCSSNTKKKRRVVQIRIQAATVPISHRSPTIVHTSVTIHLNRIVRRDRNIQSFSVAMRPCGMKKEITKETRLQIQPSHFVAKKNELKNRLNAFVNNETGDGVDRTIVGSLIEMLDQNSSIAQAFRMARDWCHSYLSVNVELRLLSKRTSSRQYNALTVAEIATLITNDFGDGDPTRDIIVNKEDGRPKRISELHTSYMALQYLLLFQYGEDGYHDKIPYHRNTGTRKTNKGYVTMKEYYAYVIQYKQNQGTTLHRGRAHDRPEIGTRVFKLRLTILLEDLTKNTIFGKSREVVYVIEFQKRGYLTPIFCYGLKTTINAEHRRT
nr:helicase [Tanacetum cinerariifolium]